MAPRFADSYVGILKRVMLPRLPECHWLPEDLEVIHAATGLSAVQIQTWAENLRHRGHGAREAYLVGQQDGQGGRASCYYVFLFNADSVDLNALQFPKRADDRRADHYYELNFVESVVNKEANCADVFLEFGHPMDESALLCRLQSLGACGVQTVAICGAGAHDEAATAVMRVRGVAAKLRVRCVVRGNPTDSLLRAVLVKQFGPTTTKDTPTGAKGNGFQQENDRLRAELRRMSKLAEQAVAEAAVQTRVNNLLADKVDTATERMEAAEGKARALENENRALLLRLEENREHFQAIRAMRWFSAAMAQYSSSSPKSPDDGGVTETASLEYA